MRFVVMGNPVGKPRMTQRDKWQKRACVMRYRDWADAARQAAPADLNPKPSTIDVVAFLPMPPSWSQRKKDKLRFSPHQQKPDADNILKAACDALFANDELIWWKGIRKFWDDGEGPRVEIEVT